MLLSFQTQCQLRVRAWSVITYTILRYIAVKCVLNRIRDVTQDAGVATLLRGHSSSFVVYISAVHDRIPYILCQSFHKECVDAHHVRAWNHLFPLFPFQILHSRLFHWGAKIFTNKNVNFFFLPINQRVLMRLCYVLAPIKFDVDPDYAARFAPYFCDGTARLGPQETVVSWLISSMLQPIRWKKNMFERINKVAFEQDRPNSTAPSPSFWTGCSRSFVFLLKSL